MERSGGGVVVSALAQNQQGSSGYHVRACSHNFICCILMLKIDFSVMKYIFDSGRGFKKIPMKRSSIFFSWNTMCAHLHIQYSNHSNQSPT